MENKERVEKCLNSTRKIAGPIDAQALVLGDLLFESIEVVDLLFSLKSEFAIDVNIVEFHLYIMDCARAASRDTRDFTVQELVDYVKSRSASR
jgi:acyl carrier protein